MENIPGFYNEMTVQTLSVVLKSLQYYIISPTFVINSPVRRGALKCRKLLKIQKRSSAV